MKLFENPEIEVIRFSMEDIMGGSNTGCSDDCMWDFGGNTCDNEIG